MYAVNLIVDDDVISQNTSTHNMHKTLVEAAKLVKGVPQAECTIRKAGKLIAWLHTNWRGELDECEVWSPVSCLITPINPAWSAFG